MVKPSVIPLRSYSDMGMTSPLRTPGPWKDPLAAYTRWLRGADYPRSTEKLRLYHLKRYANTSGLSPADTTTEALLDYLGSHQWSSATRHSNRTSLRSFFGWAYSSGLRGDDPAALLPSIRQHVGTPRPIPDLILTDALHHAGEREWLMMMLAATAGLRAVEISQVNLGDIYGQRGTYSLRVNGKGRKIRMVPISDRLAAELAERGRAHAGGWVFPGQINGHLSAKRVTDLVSDALPGEWTAHTLRHRFASQAYAGSRDIRAVQELLGHSSVATTQIYTAVPDDSIRAAAMVAQLAA